MRNTAVLHIVLSLLVSCVFKPSWAAPSSSENGDIRARTIYSIMIDRFADGAKNSYDRIYNPLKHGFESSRSQKSEFDPTHKDPLRFWGGDLAGIAKAMKEGFFEDLGVGIIHLTPFQQVAYYNPMLFQASAYHGYHPEDWFRVDPRFGRLQDFKNVARLSKAQGIGLVMDFVYNHSSARCNPASLGRVLRDGVKLTDITDEPRGGQNYTSPDKGFYGMDNDHFDSLWGVGHENVDAALKTVDGHTVEFKKVDKPDWPPSPCVVDGIEEPAGLADFNLYNDAWNKTPGSIGHTLLDAVKYWMAVSEGAIKMIRFDACTMVPPSFTLGLIYEIDKDSNLYSTGFLPEVISEDPNMFKIMPQDNPKTRAWKERVSVPFAKIFSERKGTTYDYNTYRYIEMFLKGREKFENLKNLADWWTGDEDEQKSMMIGFIGSHDHDRLATDDFNLKRTLLVMLMTAPRIPLIYYGDEGGRLKLIENAGWMDRTRPFYGEEKRKESRNTPEFAVISSLAKFRRASPALWKGSFNTRYVGKNGNKKDYGVLAFDRKFAGENVFVVVNVSGDNAKINGRIKTFLPDGHYENLLNSHNGLGQPEKIEVRNGEILKLSILSPYAVGVFVAGK